MRETEGRGDGEEEAMGAKEGGGRFGGFPTLSRAHQWSGFGLGLGSWSAVVLGNSARSSHFWRLHIPA
jgi:hypothetical protein